MIYVQSNDYVLFSDNILGADLEGGERTAAHFFLIKNINKYLALLRTDWKILCLRRSRAPFLQLLDPAISVNKNKYGIPIVTCSVLDDFSMLSLFYKQSN